MKTNIGSIDRVLRIALALVASFLVLSDAVTGTLGIVTIIVALILAVTSVVGFCPIYRILRLSTKKE